MRRWAWMGGVLAWLVACAPQAPEPGAGQRGEASAPVSAAATPPLPGPAREVSLPVSAGAPARYPVTVGQAVDHAIYRGLYEAVSPLSDLAQGGTPDVSVPDQPRGQVLTVYYTGNVHGEVEDCGCKKNPMGGLARKAQLIATSSQTEVALDRPDGFAVVDAGDLFFKSPQVGQLGERERKVTLLVADAVVEALNTMPTDAFSPGRLDLAMGAKETERLRKASRFPWVSANLRRQGQAGLWLPPFVVKEVAGRKLAFVGLIDEQDPAALREVGFEADEPRQALLAQAAPLRAAGVEGIVLLSNLGVNRTEQLVDGLDRASLPVVLAVASGTRRTTFQPIWTPRLEVPLVESGAQGKHLGRVDLHVIEGKLEVASGKSPAGSAATHYIGSYRSVHNARRTLAESSAQDAPTQERLKRSLDLSLQRLKAVEGTLPDAAPKAAAGPTSWLRSRVVPLPTSMEEEPRVRAVLDRYKARVEAAGGRWGH